MTTWREEAQARCEKATPGPWQADLSELDDVVVWAGEERPRDLVFNMGERVTMVGTTYAHDAENGQFVAHAREDLPRALALLAQCEEALAAVPGWHMGDCVHQGRRIDNPLAADARECTCHAGKAKAALAALREAP